MDKHKRAEVIRNIIWALALVAALIWAIANGHWRPFVTLAVLFVISKAALLSGKRRLKQSMQQLHDRLEEQGLPSYIPEPSVLEALQRQVAEISDEIDRLCPPQQCLRFAVDEGRAPSRLDTKLGGVPFWPTDKPFPTNADGKPMALVMQVNFGQCPQVEPLPRAGMLQFFISSESVAEGYGEDYEQPNSARNFRVVYHTEVDTEAATPDCPRLEAIEDSPVQGEYALDVQVDESHINTHTKDFDRFFAQAVKNLYGDEVDADEPGFMPTDYLRRLLPEEHRDDVAETLLTDGNPMFMPLEAECFQMLGYPCFVQEDTRPEDCPHDTLLLQIPTLEDTEAEGESTRWHTIWGDCGTAYLLISAEALRRQDFSDVRYEVQEY